MNQISAQGFYSTDELIKLLAAAKKLGITAQLNVNVSAVPTVIPNEPKEEVRELPSCPKCKAVMTEGKYGEPYCRACWLRKKDIEFKKTGSW